MWVQSLVKELWSHKLCLQNFFLIFKRDFPGGPVVDYMLPLQGAWFWSLVGEIRSCRLLVQPKKKKKIWRVRHTCNSWTVFCFNFLKDFSVVLMDMISHWSICIRKSLWLITYGLSVCELEESLFLLIPCFSVKQSKSTIFGDHMHTFLHKYFFSFLPPKR